jgi:hypothetical protein
VTPSAAVQYWLPQSAPTPTLADNQGGINLSEDQSNHNCTKHIDIKYHFTCKHTLLGHTHFCFV